MATRRTPPTPGERLVAAIAGVAPEQPGSAEFDLEGSGLQVEVTGLGRLPDRLTPTIARRLIALAAPAPFGLGTQTLVDPDVRHTWQVPTDLVQVTWGGRLEGVCAAVRDGLGLAQASTVMLELHSLLVYETGQFFAPHRDSEKADAMQATLVVTLPARHSGGELVVHDGGRETAYRASPYEPSFVVLYADRVHEVRPVRSGYRISLTFNVMVEEPVGDGGPADGLDDVAHLFDRYFTTVPTSTWSGEKCQAPARFAFLLDHEYTARGLSWSRLKGVDRERAALLRAAIERRGGEAVLALTEIHETWDADLDDRGRGSRYSSRRGRGWHDEPLTADEVDLGSLIDSELSLTHWLLPGLRNVEPVTLSVGSDEVYAATPTVSLAPYESEYEGYMGNYGNTVDRWYRRAAVLAWPATAAFAQRAEADPALAVEALAQLVAAGGLEEATTTIASLDTLWPRLVRRNASAIPLAAVLDLAARLDAASARTLLDPFNLSRLDPEHAAGLVSLLDAHGSAWVVALIRTWHERTRYGFETHEPDWFARLPALAGELRGIPEVADALLTTLWARREARLAALGTAVPTSFLAAQALSEVEPIAALLRASVAAERRALSARIVDALTTMPPPLLPIIVGLVQSATSWSASVQSDAGLEEIAWYAVGQLREELSRAPRQADDWSITASVGCACQECSKLAAFLVHRDQRVLEWPLAQSGRDHLTSQVRNAELPLTVATRKIGRPYTLVLTKSQDVFDRESARREAAEAEVSLLADFLTR